MIGVMSNTDRQEQMAIAIEHGFPMLKKASEFHNGRVSIVGYGPSLLENYRLIPHPIITVSGAHDYLLSKGIFPDMHVEIDPRAHKAAMLTKPVKSGTRYYMASCCHPDFWDILKDCRVFLWHLINGNDESTERWVAANHAEGLDSMIGGGVTAGQRAMNVAAALGYRKFNLFGMDCSFDDDRHAGPHLNEIQPVIEVAVGQKNFKTTQGLAQAASELAEFLQTVDAEVTVWGDGLLPEIANILKQRKRSA